MDTGLVRFGYRDYDPRVGRFTSPDPLGDTGGDHDVYDYCVDDPVSLVDPEGLNPFAAYQSAAYLAQRAWPHVSRLAAAAGPYAQRAGQAVANGAQAVTSTIVQGTQRAGQAMLDAGKAVGNKLGQMATKGQEAITEGAQKLHIASQADTATGKLLRAGEKGLQAAEGYVNPSGIIPESGAGKVGFVANEVYRHREQITDKVEKIVDGVKRFEEARRKMGGS